MSYTPTTWTTGDTITATAMNKIENGIANAGGSSWDAVIRLTHSNDSGIDESANLTPSIVSGSYASLMSKISNYGVPCIHIEYYHPWGEYGSLDGFITYASPSGISIDAAGYFPFGDGNNNHFYRISQLFWSSSDTIAWD